MPDNDPTITELPPPAAARTARPTELGNALAHLYRGEVGRSNTWRTRLDATTNWAVVTAGAALSFAFGGTGNPAEVIPVVTFMLLLFLFIEARRYRYYELWSYRARLLENNYFAPMLAGPGPRPGWEQRLVDSLHRPAFPITLLEALGRRYRRNYAPIFLLLAFSWVVKITIHPTTVSDWGDLMQRAAIGPVPGWTVLGFGVFFNGALVALGLFTVGLRASEGEVFAETVSGRGVWARLRQATREALEVDLDVFRPVRRGRKLVFIISDEFAALGKPLLEQLHRGVTLLKGTGMYSGREHGILLCVVRGDQVDVLKKIVYDNDPRAFVVVTGAQDVRGEGFRPLEA